VRTADDWVVNRNFEFLMPDPISKSCITLWFDVTCIK